MNVYKRVTKNPLFFKWIFHPSAELDAYWEHFLENNPEQRELIFDYKSKIEQHLRYDNKVLNQDEKKILALQIAKKLEQSDLKLIRERKIRNIVRYAAIAFLFLLIGGGLVYLYMERMQPNFVIENAALPAHVQEPVLIFGDRSQVFLNQGESQLEYSPGGKIVLNNEQMLKGNNKNDLPEVNTLVIPYGSRTTITLSDGTRVWLNAGSRLIYPSVFVDKYREVFLIGEAFFDVSKNEKQPFMVKTTDMQVEVCGTRFNVTAYPEDFAVQTVLADGSVVIKSNETGRREKEIILEPGNMAYFNKKTRETRTQKVNVDEYTLWTEGLFSFTNTDFNRIIKKLERFYNIHFQFDDPLKGGIQISGKLDVTQQRSEVFKYLEQLTGLQFIAINERNFIIK